jgi:hypothetical protein
MAAGLAQLISNGIGAGLGLFGLFHGNRQYKKGLSMFENTPFPEYDIPQEVSANQAIAARLAMSGLPDEQIQAAMNNIQRNQTFGLNALQSRGGTVGAVNSLVGTSNTAELNLEGQDAAAREANQRQLMEANSMMAQYRDKAYQVNKLQRYLMRMGMASSLMQMGNQGFNQGLNQIGISLAGAGQNISDISQNGGFGSIFGGNGGISSGGLSSGSGMGLASPSGLSTLGSLAI